MDVPKGLTFDVGLHTGYSDTYMNDPEVANTPSVLLTAATDI